MRNSHEYQGNILKQSNIAFERMFDRVGLMRIEIKKSNLNFLS